MNSTTPLFGQKSNFFFVFPALEPKCSTTMGIPRAIPPPASPACKICTQVWMWQTLLTFKKIFFQHSRKITMGDWLNNRQTFLPSSGSTVGEGRDFYSKSQNLKTNLDPFKDNFIPAYKCNKFEWHIQHVKENMWKTHHFFGLRCLWRFLACSAGWSHADLTADVSNEVTRSVGGSGQNRHQRD